MFENATTAKADVVFPLETHAEKDGTVTHPDGRLQRVRPSASRPGDIRPNWQRPRRAVLGPRPRHRHLPSPPPSPPSPTRSRSTRASPTPTSAAAASAGRTARRPPRAPLRRPRRAVRGDGQPERLRREAPPGARPADPRPTGRLLTLGTYRDLWAGPITELNPPLRFLAPQQRVEISLADAERLGLKIGDEVKVAQNGTSVRPAVAIKERVAEGVCFLIEGTAEGNANAAAQRRPGQRRDREGRSADAVRSPTPVRRSDLDHGRQVAGDLRRDLRHPADPDRGRAQADRPLPAPLRPQPGRPLRPPAAARRRRQADLQGGLPPGQRGPDAVHPRAAAAGPLRRPRRWRSSPGATSRTASASTGSTSRSGSSTSSPSARSPSTACCSAAGPRAPNTACSARCARPRS